MMLNNNKLRRVRLKVNALATKIFPSALILMYHRVIHPPTDRQKLCVSPEKFDAQMEILSSNFHLISLDDLVTGLARHSVEKRSCVVTFDDGYMDNYTHARPILEKYDVPSTVFVASKYLGVNREFWWDELDRLILSKKLLPEEISIKLNGKSTHWSVINQPVEDSWNVQSNVAANESSGRKSFTKEKIYIDLCRLFQNKEAEQIDDAIAQLREITGDIGAPRPENIAMNEEQVLSLHKGGLIEIGAHTQYHSNLAELSHEKQKIEIEGGKHDLENLLGCAVNNFSYPFGTLEHFTNHTARLVRNAGFQCALSTYPGNVSRLCNRFNMPRRVIRDWDGETFERKLSKFYS